MRGAVGCSAAMRKIRARTSLLTRLRPPTHLALETHVQYNRKPARCQPTTVLGVTRMRGCSHSDQNLIETRRIKSSPSHYHASAQGFDEGHHFFNPGMPMCGGPHREKIESNAIPDSSVVSATRTEFLRTTAVIAAM